MIGFVVVLVYCYANGYAMPYRKGRDSSCYNFSNVYLSNGC